MIAEELPELSLTLLEGRTERARQLGEAVEQLARPGSIDVLVARAEDAGRNPDLRCTFHAVVSRGFGTPAVTAECAAPFLRIGGYLICSEPPETERSVRRWPKDGTALAGLELVDRVAEPFALAILCQIEDCPARLPRRVGIPNKRPLF